MNAFTQNNKKQTRLFITFVAVLTISILIRDLMQLNINKFVFLGLVAVFLVFLDKERLVWSLCFMMPLFKGLPQTYILLLVFTLYLVKSKHINTSKFVICLIFIVLESINNLFTSSFDVSGIVQYSLCISLLILLIYDSEIVNHKTCLYAFFFGTLIFCLVIIISGLITAPSNWMDLFIRGVFRFGNTVESTTEETYMHVGCNSNELAYYSIVGFVVGIMLFKNSTFSKNKVLVLLSSIVILICGALSISRSYFLFLAILIVVYLLINIKTLKGIGSIVVLFVLGIIIFSLLNKYFPELIKTIFLRFKDADVITGNRRTELFVQYNQALFSNFKNIIFGTGATCYKEITGIYDSTHNGLQQIFLCMGIPAGFLFVFLLAKPFICSFKSTKNKELVLPFIAVVGFTQTIQFLNPYILMLPYIIGIYSLLMEDEKTNENIKQRNIAQ